MAVRVVLKGLRRFRGNLKRQERLYVKNVGSGLEEAAEIILEGARDRVPVSTGELRRSGRVRKIKLAGSVLGAEVVFGGVREVDYAIVVHEDPAQRGRKYLELAERNARGAVRSKIAETAKG